MQLEEKSAARALSNVDWPSVLPSLIRCGTRWLRAAGFLGRRGGAGAIEAQELANAAIDQLLAGERTWPRGANDDALVNILCETMRSIATNARTHASVASRRDAHLERRADGGSSPEEVLAARQLLAKIERDLEADAELTALFRAIARETKRDALAAELGWTEKKLDAARKRLARRIEGFRAEVVGGATEDA